jgi:thiamine-phosphate pyrophosphorylase
VLRCAITDGTAAGPEQEKRAEALVARCVALAEDGIDLLLLREKTLKAGDLERLARSIVHATQGAKMRLLIAGRADVAIAAGAHGVHLSSRPGELRPAQVRKVVGHPGGRLLTSVSCHTEAEVVRARRQGAHLVLFAPVFGKWDDGVEVVPGAGLERLKSACAAANPVPVLALGGVTRANAGLCAAAGAAGFAGIRLFFSAPG